MTNLLSIFTLTSMLVSGSGKEVKPNYPCFDNANPIVKGYQGRLSSNLVNEEKSDEQSKWTLEGGNDNPIPIDAVSGMELPPEFFDSDGKFINFNAFKIYFSDCWDPKMRTYTSDNVYLCIGYNQFTFDFSNFQVCTNSVNEINFNESLIPGDFQQFGKSNFLWRKLPQLEEDYDIKIKSSCNGTIDIHWDYTQTCRNVTLTSPEGDIKTFSTTPDKLDGNFPGTYQKSISEILKKFPYFSISPDQLHKEGNFYVCTYPNHGYGPKTFRIPCNSLVIGEDWLDQGPSKDVVVDASFDQWIDDGLYKNFYQVIARGVDVRFPNDSRNGIWKYAEEVAYNYYVDEDDFNVDPNSGNVSAECCLAAKINGVWVPIEYFNPNYYELYNVKRGDGFLLHVQDVEQGLAGAKNEAKGELDRWLSQKASDKDQYSDENWGKIEAAIEQGEIDIDQATTVEGINTAKEKAIAAANKVPTIVQEQAAEGLVGQTNQYKNQVNAISTADYSLLITKMDNTTPDNSSSEIAGVIDEVSDAIQDLNTKTQAAKGVIQSAKSFVETHKNDASSEVRAKIAELEEIVNSKESEITTMESQSTTLSEELVELNNAKIQAENREQAEQNEAERQEEEERVQGLVDQSNQYKNQVNAISTADYSLLITKMGNTTSDNSSNEIAGVIDEVSDAIQNLNAKTQAAKGVIQAVKSFVETHKNDASSEVRAKIAELEEIVNSKESEITTMESQRTTLSEGLVELNNAKIQAENREQTQQNAEKALEEARNSAKKYFDKVNAIEDIDIDLGEGLIFAEAMKKLDEALKYANATSTTLNNAVNTCKTAAKKYETAKQQKENAENLKIFKEGVGKIIAKIADEDGKIYGCQDVYGNTLLEKPIDDIELAKMNFSYVLDGENIIFYGYGNNEAYPLTMKIKNNPSTPVEEIVLPKSLIVKRNGTENPTIDFDFGMMGKQYIIIDVSGRVIQEGEIQNSTVEFGKFGPGTYIFGVQGMLRGTSQKVVVK